MSRPDTPVNLGHNYKKRSFYRHSGIKCRNPVSDPRRGNFLDYPVEPGNDEKRGTFLSL